MRFVSINDFHSHVTHSIGLLNALWLAKSQGDFVLDGGDFFEGTLFYCEYEGLPECQLMDHLIDFAAPGNHGFGQLRQYAFESCQVLCLNILDKTTGQPNFKPFHILETPTERILITAIMTPQVFETIPVHERAGLSCEMPWARLLALLNELDGQITQCLLMSHCGLEEDRAWCPTHPLLQLVLSAHCHAPEHSAHRGETLFIKAPEHGHGFVRGQLKAGGWQAEVVHVVPSDDDEALPIPLFFLKPYLDSMSVMATKVVGRWSTKHALEYPTRSLLTQGVLNALASMGADAIVLNETCMRHLLVTGSVTKIDLYALFPFGNSVIRAKITRTHFESQLKALEHFMPGMLQHQVDVSGEFVILLTTSHLWANFFEPTASASCEFWMEDLGLIRDFFQENFLDSKI